MEAQSVEVSALGLRRAERAWFNRSLILSLCKIQLYRISANFTFIFMTVTSTHRDLLVGGGPVICLYFQKKTQLI